MLKEFHIKPVVAEDEKRPKDMSLSTENLDYIRDMMAQKNFEFMRGEKQGMEDRKKEGRKKDKEEILIEDNKEGILTLEELEAEVFGELLCSK